MKKLLSLGLAVATALVVPSATPAAADSSACTHHWSGPQVCIRLEGRNHWNSVVAIWPNPPAWEKTRSVRLFVDGKQRGPAQVARREGGTLSYRWSRFDTGTETKLCVRFAGVDRVACDKTRYIGNRVSL